MPCDDWFLKSVVREVAFVYQGPESAIDQPDYPEFYCSPNCPKSKESMLTLATIVTHLPNLRKALVRAFHNQIRFDLMRRAPPALPKPNQDFRPPCLFSSASRASTIQWGTARDC